MAKSKTVIVTRMDGHTHMYGSMAEAAHALKIKQASIKQHAEDGTSHKGMWFKLEENGKTIGGLPSNGLAFIQSALPMIAVAHPDLLEQVVKLIKPVMVA